MFAQLPRRPQGSVRPSLLLTWLREDGTLEDLTGATLTGIIARVMGGNDERAIAGTLTVTDGPAAQFRWDLHVDDVASAGMFEVEIRGAFASGPTPAITFRARWEIVPSRIGSS